MASRGLSNTRDYLIYRCRLGRYTTGVNTISYKLTSNVQQNVSINNNILWANHTELIIEGAPDHTDGGIFFMN